MGWVKTELRSLTGVQASRVFCMRSAKIEFNSVVILVFGGISLIGFVAAIVLAIL